jgi:hypothetical protein
MVFSITRERESGNKEGKREREKKKRKKNVLWTARALSIVV